MIEVKNLKFSYNNKDIVVDDVSFRVEDGQWYSIIGHNGSGKSTISKLLIGLIEPSVGQIFINGEELTEDNVNQLRKKIGIVFQNPDNQFVGYNVKYDIAFGLENNKIERPEMIKLIDEYSKKVDMNEFLEREPETLSGGQKQRVAIAGILALNSDIIIFDEATSMLDPKGTDEVIEIIKELHTKYNKTIITITHDLNLAWLSDKIAVLKNGKIIKEGKPDEIFLERDILLSSNLDMPFGLRAAYMASLDDKLKNNKELMDALWEYHLKA